MRFLPNEISRLEPLNLSARKVVAQTGSLHGRPSFGCRRLAVGMPSLDVRRWRFVGFTERAGARCFHSPFSLVHGEDTFYAPRKAPQIPFNSPRHFSMRHRANLFLPRIKRPQVPSQALRSTLSAKHFGDNEDKDGPTQAATQQKIN